MLTPSLLAFSLCAASVLDDPKQVTPATPATPPAVASENTSAGPTPQELQKLVREFFRVVNEKAQAAHNETKEEMDKFEAEVGAAADVFFLEHNFDLAKLDEAQLAALQPIIGSSPKARTIMIGVFSDRAKAPTAAGFKAAVRVVMYSMDGDGYASTSPKTVAMALLAHPGFAAGIAGDEGEMVLTMLEGVSAKELAPHAAVIASVAAQFTPEAPMGLAQLAGPYLTVAAKVMPKDQHAAIRVAVLDCVKAKIATSKGREKASLEDMLKSLNGAAARGELVGYPVPTLTCNWVRRSDGTTPWKSLADLKGKVVVLDFWATWCGPCVGSFPKVAALRAAYSPEQVEIVGITSVQGTVHHQKREKVECKGDVAKEQAETLEFMKDMGVTWTIAMTAEDVFNPDFGVRGIPFVAIIDQDGKVYKVGLHAGDETAIRAVVDELLAKNSKNARGAATATEKKD